MIETARQEDTKKLGKAFRMLKWISIAPGLNTETLGGLLDLSARGVHRYIADLRQMGIPIKTHKGLGYSLESTDILSAVNWSFTEPEEVVESAIILG